MNAYARNMILRPFASLLALTLALVIIAHGEARAQDRQLTPQPQLDQMLAPIALYPDALLSQILMAATYPLEVVEAARWSRSYPNFVGDDAVRAAGRENWDPSVKSLLAFPQVLASMDENLQWTQALGDAFLDQEQQVMDTVQDLRRRAQAAGNLRSDERQRIVENGPIVIVQPVDPEIVYVPYYDPMVVYGSWWWPDYRPVYWRPFPGYYARPGFATGFFWGPSIRISAGFFFGAFDWPHRQVRVVQVNNNHYYYHNVAVNRRMNVVNRDRAPGTWQHDSDHRRGVAYRSAAVQQHFAGALARSDRGGRAGETVARRPDLRPDTDASAIPRFDRRGEPRSNVSRPEVQAAVQPAAQPAVQAAVLPAMQPRANADVRADRHDQGNRIERGDRSDRIERRPETRAAGVIPQTRESRGDATLKRRDPAERAERPRASEHRPQPRHEPATRLEAPRAVEMRAAISRAQPEARREAGPRPEATRVAGAQASTPRAQLEARHEAGPQRGARAEDAAQRLRQQR